MNCFKRQRTGLSGQKWEEKKKLGIMLSSLNEATTTMTRSDFFFIESDPGIEPVLLYWKFKPLTGKVTFWSIKKSPPVYLHKKHHIGSQLWVSLAGNSTRNTLLNFSIFVNLTYILKNPNYQPSTGVSYRVTSLINSAQVWCVLPSYQYYQLSTCVSYRVTTSIINSARVCPTELLALSTQHVCVLPSYH